MSWLTRTEGNSLMKVIGTTMFMLIFSTLLILALSSTTSAHGYIDEAPGRAYLCKQGLNENCGRIVHEPQSLEALKGFPAGGPADGKIASANGQFPELDEQSATRWTKVDMNSGINTFHWTITASHATTSWKYYITKPDWDPNQPLTRDSFDLTPFCDINDGGARPGYSVTHNCDVPERSGYHIILGVWEVFDTANAFYNVIDVNFSGSTTPGPGPGEGDDEEAPSVPANISIDELTATSVSLSWDASTDNVGVTGYVVTVNNDVKVVSTPSIVLTGLQADTDYSVSIQAKDAANNVSAAATIQVKTAAKAACDYPQWDANGVYVGGDHVEHDGLIYKANWWTQGDNPEQRSGQYDVWSFIGACQ